MEVKRNDFWTPGSPDGVLSNCPYPLVRALCVIRPSLNTSETVHCFFLIVCMKLGYHKDTKVTEPDFEKKLVESQMGKTTHFGGIFDVFCPYLCIQSLRISGISHTLQAQHYITPSENCMSRKNLVQLYSRDQTSILRLSHFFSVFGVCYIMSVVMQ